MSEREELLELFAPLRVADVRDGMDWNGMHHYGSMDVCMRPLERAHMVGIARTARYLPFAGPIPKLSHSEYTDWVGMYYSKICIYPWMAEVEPGDVIVIDESRVNVGLIGSNNGLDALVKGARGFVIDGGIRDTDEVILQKIPVWSRHTSQGMVQGRLQYDSMNVPVCVGGVTVCPGDVIVADNDGVIVVPRAIARDVATYARRELDNDKVGRRKLYDKLGWQPDSTVE